MLFQRVGIHNFSKFRVQPSFSSTSANLNTVTIVAWDTRNNDFGLASTGRTFQTRIRDHHLSRHKFSYNIQYTKFLIKKVIIRMRKGGHEIVTVTVDRSQSLVSDSLTMRSNLT